MATWKKVIVSGSSAELAALKVDNLTSGSVVIGGGSAGNLSTIAINGTGNIVATTGATVNMSGSFSGSFVGSGAGLSGVAASFPATEKTNLVTADKLFIQNSVGAASEYVTYGNLLTDLAGTNLAVEGSDSLQLATTITGITSVSATSFTGSLLGTATTASYVLQAVSASFATSAASATTASYVLQAVSASFATLAQTANTASYVLNAVSASQAANATSASFATLAQTANTASYVLQAVSASNANLLDGLDSTAFAVLSSANTFTNNQIISGTLSVAVSGITEFQVFATGVKIGNVIGDIHTITGSVNVSGSVTATSFIGPLTGTASFATSASRATSASFASTAATATSATQVANSLTLGDGLTGAAFNGSAAVTAAVGAGALITVSADAVSVSTSSFTANQIPKLSGGALAGSNITDTGTQVQIGSGASSGVTVAAGGISVTGNSTFNNNLTVSGDLTVNGTASFVNSTNLYVKDQFITINSGSSTLTDSGIVSQYNAAGSGSAWFLEAGSAGTYGRWAVAYDVLGTSTSVTADEFVVTAKINQASNPSAAPVWGGSGNGSGNIWVTNAGDVFIYA